MTKCFHSRSPFVAREKSNPNATISCQWKRQLFHFNFGSKDQAEPLSLGYNGSLRRSLAKYFEHHTVKGTVRRTLLLLITFTQRIHLSKQQRLISMQKAWLKWSHFTNHSYRITVSCRLGFVGLPGGSDSFGAKFQDSSGFNNEEAQGSADSVRSTGAKGTLGDSWSQLPSQQASTTGAVWIKSHNETN